MENKSLTLVRGLPGSGKSKFAHFLVHGKDNIVVLSVDNYYLDNKGNYRYDKKKEQQNHEKCREECAAYLERGFSVIVANTFTRDSELAPYESLANEHNATFYSVIMERRHAGKNVHGIPEEKVYEMHKKFVVKLY